MFHGNMFTPSQVTCVQTDTTKVTEGGCLKETHSRKT